jgi:hypothetical protein
VKVHVLFGEELKDYIRSHSRQNISLVIGKLKKREHWDVIEKIEKAKAEIKAEKK